MNEAKKKPEIAIRCDGNRQIGGGHLMRCASIAEALAKKGARVRFYFSDEESRQLFRREDVETIILHTDYRHPEEETELLAGELHVRGTDAILIDSYDASDGYLRKLRNAISSVFEGNTGEGSASSAAGPVKLCILDDFCTEGRPADLIINYLKPGRQQYVPLRGQFAGVRMAHRSRPEKLFLSSGASDPYDMKQILTERIATDFPQLTVMIPEGVTDMAAYMASCDLAVTAGGTTVYELCAVGVPAVMYTMADNQQSLAEGVRDAVRLAGDIRDEEERAVVTDRILSWIGMMLGNEDARREQAAREASLTDGCGAARIADEILSGIPFGLAG